ncbi:hypothetical protein ID866_5121 [Astraeus odoratus]|nr:hypothetical protein ID866_5121 [Astraeus odoratus]
MSIEANPSTGCEATLLFPTPARSLIDPYHPYMHSQEALQSLAQGTHPQQWTSKSRLEVCKNLPAGLLTQSRPASVVFHSEVEDYLENTENIVRQPPKANDQQQHILSVSVPTRSQVLLSQLGPFNVSHQHEHEIAASPERPSPRVHFRSRVRITAGIGRRRRLSDGLSSSASSLSGSPSSSISAPLRTPDSEGSKGWGPLGRRVSLLASQPGHGRRQPSLNGNGNGDGNGKTLRRKYSSSLSECADERTRLVSFYNGYSYTADPGRMDPRAECEHLWRERVVDATFGQWPWRLLNRHWWWWQVEPIVCCFCICGDPDEEGTY